MDLVDPDALPSAPLSFMNADHLVEAGLLNELGEVLAGHCEGREDASAVIEALARLYVALHDHFAREEALLEQESVPDHQAHRLEHRRLLASIQEAALQFRVARDAVALWVYVSTSLPGWCTHHMEHMDLPAARSLVGGEG